MAVDRAARQLETLRDLGTRQPFGREAGELKLSRRKPADHTQWIGAVLRVAQHSLDVRTQRDLIAGSQSHERDPLFIDECSVGRLEVEDMHDGIGSGHELRVLSRDPVVLDDDIDARPSTDHDGLRAEHDRTPPPREPQIEDRHTQRPTLAALLLALGGVRGHAARA